jgi:hypothetical protein
MVIEEYKYNNIFPEQETMFIQVLGSVPGSGFRVRVPGLKSIFLPPGLKGSKLHQDYISYIKVPGEPWCLCAFVAF